MRLYLAVAVLMLAFVAYTEAQDPAQDQDQERTVQQKLADFSEQMATISRDVAAKAKTSFEDLNNSQFAVDTRDWFQRQFDAIKQKLGAGDQ